MHHDGERGAAVLEFALVAPLLLALLYGIIDFSYIWNYNSRLDRAAIAAARYYAIPRTGVTVTQMQQSATQIVSDGVGGLPASATVSFCVDSTCGASVKCPTAAGPSAGIVKIKVTASPSTVTRAFGSTFTATSTAQVPCS